MGWLPFNLELLRNPYNWLVVALMVVILGLSLHLIFSSAELPTAGDTAN